MVHMVLNNFRTDIHAFQVAWNSILQKKLRPYFISPTNLALVLSKIPLANDVQLTIPVTPESIHAYYPLITPVPMHNGSHLFLFFHVPLVQMSKYCTLFRPYALPVQFNNSNVFTFYKAENSLLAVSRDLQTHINLEPSQLVNCKGDEIRVCQVMAPIIKFPATSCAFSLFMSYSEGVKSSCERHFIKSPSPRFYGSVSGRTWAYSVSQPMRLTLYSLTGTPMTGMLPAQITDSGLIKLPPKSLAVVDGITLATESTFYYKDAGDELNQFVIPSFPELPAFVPTQAQDQKSELIQKIEDLLNSSSFNTDLIAAVPQSRLDNLLKEADSDVSRFLSLSKIATGQLGQLLL